MDGLRPLSPEPESCLHHQPTLSSRVLKIAFCKRETKEDIHYILRSKLGAKVKIRHIDWPYYDQTRPSKYDDGPYAYALVKFRTRGEARETYEALKARTNLDLSYPYEEHRPEKCRVWREDQLNPAERAIVTANCKEFVATISTDRDFPRFDQHFAKHHDWLEDVTFERRPVEDLSDWKDRTLRIGRLNSQIYFMELLRLLSRIFGKDCIIQAMRFPEVTSGENSKRRSYVSASVPFATRAQAECARDLLRAKYKYHSNGPEIKPMQLRGSINLQNFQNLEATGTKEPTVDVRSTEKVKEAKSAAIGEEEFISSDGSNEEAVEQLIGQNPPREVDSLSPSLEYHDRGQSTKSEGDSQIRSEQDENMPMAFENSVGKFNGITSPIYPPPHLPSTIGATRPIISPSDVIFQDLSAFSTNSAVTESNATGFDITNTVATLITRPHSPSTSTSSNEVHQDDANYNGTPAQEEHVVISSKSDETIITELVTTTTTTPQDFEPSSPKSSEGINIPQADVLEPVEYQLEANNEDEIVGKEEIIEPCLLEMGNLTKASEMDKMEKIAEQQTHSANVDNVNNEAIIESNQHIMVIPVQEMSHPLDSSRAEDVTENVEESVIRVGLLDKCGDAMPKVDGVNASNQVDMFVATEMEPRSTVVLVHDFDGVGTVIWRTIREIYPKKRIILKEVGARNVKSKMEGDKQAPEVDFAAEECVSEEDEQHAVERPVERIDDNVTKKVTVGSHIVDIMEGEAIKSQSTDEGSVNKTTNAVPVVDDFVLLVLENNIVEEETLTKKSINVDSAIGIHHTHHDVNTSLASHDKVHKSVNADSTIPNVVTLQADAPTSRLQTDPDNTSSTIPTIEEVSVNKTDSVGMVPLLTILLQTHIIDSDRTRDTSSEKFATFRFSLPNPTRLIEFNPNTQKQQSRLEPKPFKVGLKEVVYKVNKTMKIGIKKIKAWSRRLFSSCRGSQED
ncbi:hypothetical protein HDU76_013981 [Blyttiomyces sp. JEL0837]|nr:hypothetical protein HDU76_013981 [Blyttiomyces sp. JEL0837]